MALIDTREGTFDANVSFTEELMRTTTFSFKIARSHPLVRSGALQPWQPIRISLSDAEEGGDAGGRLNYPAWITQHSGDEMLTITAKDSSIALDRLKMTAAEFGFDAAMTAGEFGSLLIASLNEGAESRRGWNATAQEDRRNKGESVLQSSWWHKAPSSYGGFGDTPIRWDGFAADGNPNSAARGQATTSATSSTLRRLRVGPFRHVGINSITKAVVRLRHRADPGVRWSNSMRLISQALDPTNEGYDGETQTIAEVLIPARETTTEEDFDITALISGTYTNVNDVLNDFSLDFIVEASSASSSRAWWIYDVQLILTWETGPTPWPVRIGQYDEGGPSLTAPATTQLWSIRQWLDWAAEQAGYEWRINDDPLIIGGAYLDWQSPVGDPVTFGSLDDGGNITNRGVTEDGEERYSRVRVTTATNPSYAIATDNDVAREIGIHEFVTDIPKGTPITGYAETVLARVSQYQLIADVGILRRPHHWSGMRIGDTAQVWLRYAPVQPWSGVMRVLRRAVNEDSNAGEAGLQLAAVDGTLQATDQLSPQPVSRPANQVRETPEMRDDSWFQKLVDFIVRENRSS